MDKLKSFYSATGDDVDPSLLEEFSGGWAPPVQGEDVTSVVTLDLDADTVAQAISVLRPVFQRFESGEEPLNPGEDSTTIIAIYACDPVGEARLRHVWEFIKRNALDISLEEVSLLVIITCSSNSLRDVVLEDLLVEKEVSDKIQLAIPNYLIKNAYDPAFLTPILTRINTL